MGTCADHKIEFAKKKSCHIAPQPQCARPLLLMYGGNKILTIYPTIIIFVGGLCCAKCGANGCHLLCHNDVIGTWKSLIYNLPDQPRNHMEQWGRRETRTPLWGPFAKSCGGGGLPVKTILPAFNPMAYLWYNSGWDFTWYRRCSVIHPCSPSRDDIWHEGIVAQ